ncbi:unannotated protein [freshwater metagenome]|uniref:Unannotated protein n=1 Tax=freshwater metagenome TaxID=449393 RepID=A0A6J6X0C6_9ZZZZ|nr:antibiotic biosynthesis monooxygenase [Actinomycetota bacterium]MSV64650.1 antibiotic biosynthesis monooxygenase [Actinomycetota bacterium]MSW27008.1 antibiotic biosynthesis monooxygenase [Actinomycetota bacterium]MSW34762.1 antibiotic biosynthesis monooxygenase [Actinomycetota bacterium]MSX31354.1 antibiotic biosynthesis monooxygenase [Actinomycetota bacterium]
MITEIAFIEVISENHTAFEVAVRKAVAEILPQAKGYVDFELQKGIEQPNTYCFHIRWETLEDHTIGFRESELFVQWRSIIGGYFAKPPIVEHWASV